MSNLLEVKDLSVSYGAIQALRKVSITVEEGSIVAILGSNGGGKTTLLKKISGLIEAVEGTVRFAGEDITNLSAEKIASLGIVQSPEGRQVFSDLTVEENLSIGAFTLKAKDGVSRKVRLKENLKRVYKYFPVLKERKNQVALTLSGGEQQMLAISRALMASPKLLILDEPSLGLAPLIVRDIFQIIKEFRNEGTTILIVEQNALQTLKIADYTYVLQVGEVIIEGKAEELKKDHKLVEAYLGK
ncbi:High-affinity branched-chain amino acid transport ATP-binding protein LivF [Candidatus Izimaplasma bacterium HR1]|jgi:branched-chain amino acid transport system ATP-binding protein|nr:High-affinity branched-chain amino acid transport ATP-binding protein LivF [Candidatus Izimaplasma bacterium HR1]